MDRKLTSLLVLVVVCSIGISCMASEPTADTNAAPILKLSHFPNRLHAFVWRNWESVSIDRMAKAVNTTPENIAQIGESMGLPPQAAPSPEYMQRGYISIIMRNWHLLSYDQLLVLLGWNSEQLDFTLRADDFLWAKLGGMKPACPPLKYTTPDDEAKKRCAEIKKLVTVNFADQLSKPQEPRFNFIKEISKADPRPAVQADSKDESIRFIYSYFAPYGDPLLHPELDPFPDGLLQRLSEVGVNGVWLHVVLSQLAPSKTFPEFGKDYQTRLENLRNMTERAKRYGVKIYLYINEPRAKPPEFFKNRENIKGVHYTGVGDNLYTMCTSTTEVRQWISESMTLVFKEVPDLGGIFTISASENISNCWAHHHPEDCPRCSKRTGPEVVSEINRTIAEGVWKGNPNAKVICWDWGWKDEWIEEIINALPEKVYLATVSEWGLPINRGMPSTITEYSISAVGPSERAKHRWALAKKRGLKTIAKVQINTTWELSTLPYLPAMNLVAQHCDNLTKMDINGLMLSWSLGGSPSPNLQLAQQFFKQPKPTIEEALTTVAKNQYGQQAVPDVLDAWSKFSTAFAEYPFSQIFIYLGPIQTGPANILYPEPTRMMAKMVGFPFDDINGWTGVNFAGGNWEGKYRPEILASQFEKMVPIWQQGLVSFKKAFDNKMTSAQKENARKDYQIAEAAGLHFKSAANQIRFILARNKLLTGAISSAEREELIKAMKAIAVDEMAIAKRFFVLAREDSRFGWEASNQYKYFPFDLIEKTIDCDYILNTWLTSQTQR
jgi:hypothetical protein